MPKNKKPHLTVVEEELKQRWGPDAVMRASDPRLHIARLPTGILSLDIALGGGVARARHTEIYGGYAVGKTYTTYRLIATTQQSGGRCAFVDAENTFDPAFAARCGVDIDELSLHPQEHGNRCIDFMVELLESQEYDVIVLDSIAALLSKSEHESSMDAGSMGTEQARLMSKALRKLTVANRPTNKGTALVYINQQREAIGKMFGPKWVTSGGRAMPFYASTRIEMVRTETIKRKAKIIDHKTMNEKTQDVVKGHRVLLKIEKDKTSGATTGSQTTFVFDYDIGGVDPIEDLLYLGRVAGIVKKKGQSWWMDGYEEEKSQGKAKFKKWIRKNRAVREELEELIVEKAKEGDARSNHRTGE